MASDPEQELQEVRARIRAARLKGSPPDPADVRLLFELIERTGQAEEIDLGEDDADDPTP